MNRLSMYVDHKGVEIKGVEDYSKLELFVKEQVIEEEYVDEGKEEEVIVEAKEEKEEKEQVIENMKYEVHEIKSIHETFFSDAKENKEFTIPWDCGTPETVAGKIWVEDYLGRLGKKLEDLKIEKTRDSFKFGESMYKSFGKIRMPVHLKDKEGRFRSEEVEVHMIEKKVKMADWIDSI